jgi:hypothetical protein
VPVVIVLSLELENEADAKDVVEKLRADHRVCGAEITLPNGKKMEFDRYLNELKAKQKTIT